LSTNNNTLSHIRRPSTNQYAMGRNLLPKMEQVHKSRLTGEFTPGFRLLRVKIRVSRPKDAGRFGVPRKLL
jgi:hypothetical protein